jgi:hypothetical protein
MSKTPAGVTVEVLRNPQDYSIIQIENACAIAKALNRGKLVLCAPPEGTP